MESLFLSFWNRGVAAGWLILAVILLRLVLKKAPKAARRWLWGLVGLRLLCPFSIQSALSLIPSPGTVPLGRDAFYVRSGEAALNTAVNGPLVNYYETAGLPAGHAWSEVSICAAVWLAGAALMLLWALVSWWRLRRRLAEAVPEGDGVWLCGQIDTPFLLGLFRPRIYLPEGLDEESRAHVLAHERCHLRRRDHWVKLLAYLLLSVYWCQTLVWAAYVLLCRDIELACDEEVVRNLDPAGKKSYSQALLRCSIGGRAIAACPLAFGEVGVKERVKNVLNYKKPAFWVTIAAVLLCVVAAVCFLTDPVEKTEEDPAAAPLAAGEEIRTYTGGALLYMQAALNYLPIDGSYYARVQEGGGKLDITFSDGETYSGELADLESLNPLFLQAGFDNYARDIGLVKRLCPDNCSVKGRVYSDGDRDFTLWQFSEADGGALWLGEGSIVSSRLYELIDLEEAFPAPESGGFLWTANGRNFLPVSFDQFVNVSVTSGTLYHNPGRGGGRKLSNTLGTIYWSPYGEDGTIPAGARLHYEIQGTETQWTSMGDITLRPVSKSVGGFGQTYALECAWAENVSRFPSALVQDPDTGELMVSTQPGEVQGIGRIVSQNAWWLEYPQTADAGAE